MDYSELTKEELLRAFKELKFKYDSINNTKGLSAGEGFPSDDSEQRFGTIFRTQYVGIGISRLSDDRFIEVNDAFLNIFGYTRDEVLEHTSSELGLWPDPFERKQMMNTFLYEGKVRNIEAKFRRKTGEIGDLQISVDILTLNGQPHMMGTLLDITEQKSNYLKLNESKQRFFCLFESSNVPIIIVKVKDKKIVEVNKAACQQYGYTTEEMLQLNIMDISAEPEKTYKYIDEAMAFATVRIHKKRDGTIFPVEISAGYFELNNELFHTAFMRDVTESNRVLEDLRISKESLNKVFQAIPDGFVISRLSDGLFYDVNREWENMFGYSKKEAVGRTAFEFNFYKYPEERQKLKEIMSAQGFVRDYEIEMVTRSGDVKQILLSTQPILFNSELCNVSIVRDLTEKHKAEAALNQ